MRINSQNYTRRQALNDLMKVENRQDDAVDNLKMIVGSLGDEESLKEATDGFIGVLNQLGASETKAAQAAYRQVDRRVKKGENRRNGLDNFVAMVRAENKPEDAVGNFDSVSRAVDKGLERDNSTENFHQILKSVGANETGFARRAFETITKSLKSEEVLDNAVDDFGDLLRVENKIEDAISGYSLVDESLQSGESRESAIDSLENLISGFGANETNFAHSAYKKIHGRVAQGEDRELGTKTFLQLLSRENKLADAEGNFDSVSRAVDRGFSRSMATGEFNSLLSKVGANETRFARDEFGIVLNSLRENEQLSEALDLHSDIMSAENKLEDVSSGYRLVDTAVSDKVSRADATEYYVSLLGEYGASDTTGAQKAFRETHEIILG